jgi:hypothetical protein
VASVVGSGGRRETPAQLAVAAGLLKAVGVPPLTPGSAIYRAALRFAALPAAARHAWLLRHLPALRAGHLTLTQIP